MTDTDDREAAAGRIYHMTTRPEWDEAQATGIYRRSTRGRSAEDVAFIR